jgi:hypothetical protein
MIIRQFIFLTLFGFFSTVQPQGEYQVLENLNDRFKVLTENIFKDKVEQNSQAVHLTLDLSEHRGHFLSIESKEKFYVFINSQVDLRANKALRFSADSLRNK